MSQHLKFIRSSVPGKVPELSAIQVGEIALNTADGIAYTKISGSSGEQIVALNSSITSSAGLSGGQSYFLPVWTSESSIGVSKIYQSGSYTEISSSVIISGSLRIGDGMGTPGKYSYTQGVGLLINVNNAVQKQDITSIQLNISELDSISFDVVEVVDDTFRLFGGDYTADITQNTFISIAINGVTINPAYYTTPTITNVVYDPDTDTTLLTFSGFLSTYYEIIGRGLSATGEYSQAHGFSTISLGTGSHAEGEITDASGSYSHAEGGYNKAIGDYSHAEGYLNEAIGIYSHVEGGNNKAYSDGAHAEGAYTEAIGIYSHSEGLYSKSIGESSHSEGDSNQAIGNYSHAEGYNTQAIGSYSHSEGLSSQAIGDAAHAEGNTTEATGGGSHAEGVQTKAIGAFSHAEGNQAQAVGEYSHAEGFMTIAVDSAAHAEGDGTNAFGYASHAEGEATVAYGVASHAEGLGTVASGSHQHVQGRYNTHGNTTSLFIIGNGINDNTRSDLALFNTSSIIFNSSLTVTGGLTGSLQGTSSYALTASHLLGGSSLSIQATAIGSTPTGSGVTVSGSFITLQPANELFGGVLTTSSQNITGSKTFTSNIRLANYYPIVGEPFKGIEMNVQGGAGFYYGTAYGLGAAYIKYDFVDKNAQPTWRWIDNVLYSTSSSFSDDNSIFYIRGNNFGSGKIAARIPFYAEGGMFLNSELNLNNSTNNGLDRGVQLKISPYGGVGSKSHGYAQTSNVDFFEGNVAYPELASWRWYMGGYQPSLADNSTLMTLGPRGLVLHSASLHVGQFSSIEPSAAFNVVSTTKGVLFPRMTRTQRNAISTPATGTFLYNSTDKTYNYYDGFEYLGIKGVSERANPFSVDFTTIPTNAHLNNFINQSTGSLSVSGSELVVGGTPSVTTFNTVNYPVDFMGESWRSSCTIKATVSGASQVFGLGTRNTTTRGGSGTNKAISLSVDISSGANKGLLTIFSGANGSFTSRASNAGNLLPINANDVIRLTLTRSGALFTGVAENVTQGVSRTVTYTYPIQAITDPVLPNTSRPCFYQLSQQNVNVGSFKFEMFPELVGGICDVLIHGDSKTEGYNTTTNSDRYTEQVKNTLTGRTIKVMAGFGDETADTLKTILHIVRIKPRVLVLAIGSNDLRNSVTDAVLYNNLLTIYNTCTAASIKVVFLGMAEGVISQANLWEKAKLIFGESNCVFTYPDLAADNVHLVSSGHTTVATALSSKLSSLV